MRECGLVGTKFLKPLLQHSVRSCDLISQACSMCGQVAVVILLCILLMVCLARRGSRSPTLGLILIR